MDNSNMQNYLERIQNQESLTLRDLYESEIRNFFNSQSPVPGVLVIFHDCKPVYVGQSGNLAQRVGKDIRSLQSRQSNVLSNLMQKTPGIHDMKMAREYAYNNYTIKMLRIDNEAIRDALFEYLIS